MRSCMCNQEKNIEISVIIPCYNCEELMSKCFKALENQTFRKFEVICIDDCSLDRTYLRLEQYRQKSKLDIKIVKNKTNIGPAKSRNAGLDVAKGNWFAFCDADDWYESNFLEKMYMKAHEDTSDLVMCEYQKIFMTNKNIEIVHYLSDTYKDMKKDDWIAYSKSSLCLLLIRREVIDNLKIPDFRNGEDIAFVPCLLFRANKISAIKEPLYNYLIRSNSASNKASEKIYLSLCSAYRFIEENFSQNHKEALEFLGIRTILYGATLNAFKAGVDFSKIESIITEFINRYPKWDKNKYMITFPNSKKIYLKTIKLKLLWLSNVIAKIHGKVSL